MPFSKYTRYMYNDDPLMATRATHTHFTSHKGHTHTDTPTLGDRGSRADRYGGQYRERRSDGLNQYRPELACVLREHRSPDSLVILPLLLAAAAAFGPGTFTELGETCTSPTLTDFLLSL